MKLDDRYVYACEKLGWTVKEYDDGTINISQYSPAGEDFFFEVESADGFAEKVRDYYLDFDVDEHVELWLPSRGERGVPASISALLYDAEAIENMLEELSIAVSEVDRT